jgi:NTE family protein
MPRPYYIFATIILLALSNCSQLKVPHINKLTLQPSYSLPCEADIALVLGGGGTKGMAHLGVLEVLEENKIPIDIIIGTSSGSAVGALYAANPDAKALKKKLMKLSKKDFLDPSIFEGLEMVNALKGPIKGERYERFLDQHLSIKKIEELHIPLVIVTVDITSNQIYLINAGPIVPAVHASSAIPPIFSPVSLYGRTLVDGGVIAPVPVNVAKQYNPKLIIAVDISAPPPKQPVSNMLSLTYRSIWIYYYELARTQSKFADIDIHPKLDGHGTFDDHNKHSAYLEGYKAAEQAIPLIKQKLANLGLQNKHGCRRANHKH